MRFHMGISFSWKSIKKFIIPFILGILAYLGFNGIFDNFNLGFIKVNAQENYDTYYDLHYYDYSYYLNSKVDENNVSLNDFLEHVINLSSDDYDIMIFFNPYYLNYNPQLYDINLVLFPKQTSFPISVVGQGSYVREVFASGSSSYNGIFYHFNFSSLVSDIYNTQNYLDFYNCYISNSSCVGALSKIDYSAFRSNSSTGNSNNFDIWSTPTRTNSYNIGNGFIYYCSKPIYLSTYNTYVSSTDYYYKTIKIDDVSYSIGDYFPTYYEYIESNQPDLPDVPGDDTTVHKGLFDKIYWLDDKNTEKGILTSIYELLFLYCLTMILFKISTCLKNKRW